MIDSRVQKIADHYGKNNQILKSIEEMAELQQALLKGEPKHIAEEIADVEIMLEQLKYLMKNEELVIIFRDMKIGRQITRMEEK